MKVCFWKNQTNSKKSIASNKPFETQLQQLLKLDYWNQLNQNEI